MSQLLNLESTIVAPATSLNQASALGIVRLSGALALAIARKITGHKSFKPRNMSLCTLLDHNAMAIDRGLVVFFPGPFSATGEDVLEFHTHGNPLILNKILEACCFYGAQIAQPGEFLYRAFWHGKYDLTQIEGISHLIHGRTTQALMSGMSALQGRVSKRLHNYAARLVQFRCQLESSLDFSDQEDVQTHQIELCARALTVWIAQLSEDLQNIKNNQFSSQGIELFLIGPPNAGKSSFLNALADDEISIIDDQPGTTRDIVKKQIVLQGVPVLLCDTAGLRATACRIEAKGIEKAKKAIETAQVIVYIIPDGEEPDLALIPNWDALPAKKYLLLNKTDQSNRLTGRRTDHAVFDAVFAVSLKTGAGLQEWKTFFEKDCLCVQNEESVWLASLRQQQYLQQSLAFAQEALEKISQTEIAAQFLCEAHTQLGKITGTYSHDDLLGDIFSSFCIGK